MKEILLPVVIFCVCVCQLGAQDLKPWTERLNNLEQINDPNKKRFELLELSKQLTDIWRGGINIEQINEQSKLIRVDQTSDKKVTIVSFGSKTYQNVYQLEWLVKTNDEIWTFSEEFSYVESKEQLNLSYSLSKTSFDTYEFLVLNGKQEFIHVVDIETKCLFEKLHLAETDQQKDSINTTIQVRLGNLWSNSQLYESAFSGLSRMKTVTSKDRKVKICTYNIQKSDFSQQFYGAVILKDDGEISVKPLTDATEKIRTPERASLTDKKWYGAIYLDIIETYSGNKTYYTLIGYKGHDEFIKTRVIDVMLIQNGRIRFGMPVFKTERLSRSRVIFKYSAKAAMMLRYDQREKLIVFDNLVPADPMYRGVYHYYGPDFSYNAFKFTKGAWELKRDIDLRNPKQ